MGTYSVSIYLPEKEKKNWKPERKNLLDALDRVIHV